MKKIVPHDAILIPPEAKRVFEGVIFDVYQWQQKMYNGTMATFERLKRPDTVLVIGIVDDKILIVEDEQPNRGETLKLPGGRVDPGDDSPLVAVQREVREETGYKFADWRLINVVQPENKIEWFVHIYVASNMTYQGAAANDGGERIKNVLKSFYEVKRMVHEGQGMLGYSRSVFEPLESIEDLKNILEFRGQEIDR